MMVAVALSLAWFGGLEDRPLQDDFEQRLNQVLSRPQRLTDDDYEFLFRVGDRAFPSVHKAVIERIRAARKSWTQENRDKVDVGIEALAACATPKRTSTMVELTKVTDTLPRNELYRWLADKGEPGLVRGLFELGIKKEPDGYYDYRRSYCTRGLIRIGDEKAVGVLLFVMNDPNTFAGVQATIFRDIASTRNPRALAAVRGLLATRVPPSPIPKDVQVRPPDRRMALPAHARSGNDEWALFEWDGLGSSCDLWIARKSGDKFVDPAFTGVSSYWPMHLPIGTYTEGGDEHKAMIDRLSAGEWVVKFVSDPSIRADSDGDGYTDIAERWLGLDPLSADTDGDKVPDALDKNPTTPRRQLSDEELALRVACEVLVSGTEGRNVFFKFPDGIKPIELQMHHGIVLLLSDAAKSRMTRPDAVFGVRMSVKGPYVSGDKATVTYEVDGGYYVSGGKIEVVKIDGHWYPSVYQMEFSVVS